MDVLVKHWLMVAIGAMQWKFHDALDGLTQDEIAALSLDDIKKRDELAMEQNAWTVAQNVAEKINQSRTRSSWRLHAIISDPTQDCTVFLQYRTTMPVCFGTRFKEERHTRICIL